MSPINVDTDLRVDTEEGCFPNQAIFFADLDVTGTGMSQKQQKRRYVEGVTTAGEVVVEGMVEVWVVEVGAGVQVWVIGTAAG